MSISTERLQRVFARLHPLSCEGNPIFNFEVSAELNDCGGRTGKCYPLIGASFGHSGFPRLEAGGACVG